MPDTQDPAIDEWPCGCRTWTEPGASPDGGDAFVYDPCPTAEAGGCKISRIVMETAEDLGRALTLKDRATLDANRQRRPTEPYIPEGQIVIIEAFQRKGKTLVGTAAVASDYKAGRRVFSNIQLGFPHTPLEFGDFSLENGEAAMFYGASVFIDEGNFFADSRKSMSDLNIKFTAWVLQLKKMGCNLYITTHALAYLEKRLRENFDQLWCPTAIPAYPETPVLVAVEVISGPLQEYRDPWTFYLPAQPYFPLFDSKAVYDPFKSVEEPTRRKGSRDPPPGLANLE